MSRRGALISHISIGVAWQYDELTGGGEGYGDT